MITNVLDILFPVMMAVVGILVMVGLFLTALSVLA